MRFSSNVRTCGEKNASRVVLINRMMLPVGPLLAGAELGAICGGWSWQPVVSERESELVYGDDYQDDYDEPPDRRHGVVDACLVVWLMISMLDDDELQPLLVRRPTAQRHGDGTESCEKVAAAADCEIIELRLGFGKGEVERKTTLKRIIDLKRVVCDYV